MVRSKPRNKPGMKPIKKTSQEKYEELKKRLDSVVERQTKLIEPKESSSGDTDE